MLLIFKKTSCVLLPLLILILLLSDYVGKTFVQNKEGQHDLYSLINDGKEQTGIDENKYDFAQGRWCYDTPGVMHPDQVN